jgi:hypothetical protein
METFTFCGAACVVAAWAAACGAGWLGAGA